MRLTRPAMLMCLAMMASACGDDNGSPTEPSNIISIAGTWSGTYQVVRCTEPPLLPAGVAVCPSIVIQPGTDGSPQPVTFTITQNESVLGGSVTFSGWLGGTTTPPATPTGITVPLTGSIERGGAFSLNASLNTTDPACPNATIRTNLTNFRATVNRDRNEMTLGSFDLVTSRRVGATGCNYYEVAIGAERLTATLQPRPTTQTR